MARTACGSPGSTIPTSCSWTSDSRGSEAFAELRADPKTSSIPVVALTASVTPNDCTRIAQAGFDAFLAKPMVLREFLDTVKRLVESRRT